MWYGAIFGLTLLWSIKAALAAGLALHLLGVSLFTLLAGPALALIGTAAVVAITTALRDGLWANYALNTLAMGAVPVLVTAGMLRLADRWLPPNFFIYIFVVSFFGAAAAMSAAGLFASAAILLADGPRANSIVNEHLPYLIFLAFGEATLTGMLTTLLVVYRPAWVRTFDDARYLRGR